MNIPPWSDAVVNMYRQGKSLREIGETLGMSITPIREQLLLRLNAEGYYHLRFNKPESEKTLRIKEALNDGDRVSDIAKREGCSRNWVYKIKNGVHRLSKSEIVDKRIKNLADKDYIDKKLGMPEMTQEQRNKEIEEIERLLR